MKLTICKTLSIGVAGLIILIAVMPALAQTPQLVPIHAYYSGVSTPQSRAAAQPAIAAKAATSAPVVPFLGRTLLSTRTLTSLRAPAIDTALQQTFGPLVSSIPGVNVPGLGVDFPGYTIHYIPPDTNAAVGTTQVVETVNMDFQVFNKANGTPIGTPTALQTFFPATRECGGLNNLSDPIVKFDQMAKQWVMTWIAFDDNFVMPHQCIVVSKTDDATGAYYVYQYDFGFAPGLNDYDKMGVWPDAWYMTWNWFAAYTGSFQGAAGCGLDRTQLTIGNATTGWCFLPDPEKQSLLPSDLDGVTGATGSTSPPPTGSPNFMVGSLNGTNAFAMWKFKVDFTTPPGTLSGPFPIATAPYSLPCGGFSGNCIPQPGTTRQLDTLGDRLMFRAAYRNFTVGSPHESLVVSHSITANNACGVAVRWYELRGLSTATPAVYQQGTFSPDNSCRWMPSMAMDKFGNMALGYSVSDASSVYPSIRYTGRLVADPVNTMQPETNIIAGAGSQTGYSRWGDYSSMAIDPTDDCTFWYAQEYFRATHSYAWSTRLASFRFLGCGKALAPTITKAFSPTQTTVNGTSTITYTITNPNGIDLTGLAFTDNMPIGLRVNNPPNVMNSCGGTFAANPGAIQVSLTNGSVYANSSCSISVTVVATSPGIKDNMTSPITSNESDPGSPSNIATLIVTKDPTFTSISSSIVMLNGFTGVKLTAYVFYDLGPVVPGGTVQFIDNYGNVLATVPLVNSRASYTFFPPRPYYRTVYAVYSGDSNFLGSKSGTVTVMLR